MGGKESGGMYIAFLSPLLVFVSDVGFPAVLLSELGGPFPYLGRPVTLFPEDFGKVF